MYICNAKYSSVEPTACVEFSFTPKHIHNYNGFMRNDLNRQLADRQANQLASRLAGRLAGWLTIGCVHEKGTINLVEKLIIKLNK